MEYKVQLLSYFNHYLPKDSKGDTLTIKSDRAMTVADIFKRLNIEGNLINICLLSVNGAAVKKNHTLTDGDFLAIMPIFDGG